MGASKDIAPDLFAAAWLRDNPDKPGHPFACKPSAAIDLAVTSRPQDFAWLSRVEPVYQSFKAQAI